MIREALGVIKALTWVGITLGGQYAYDTARLAWRSRHGRRWSPFGRSS